jgi:hypothetical protein
MVPSHLPKVQVQSHILWWQALLEHESPALRVRAEIYSFETDISHQSFVNRIDSDCRGL